MIKDIEELNLPDYATLSEATCNMQDMGEKTITTQVRINGEITPDFSFDWMLKFKGEKYIMPLRLPQGAKENTSLSSTIDLVFQHWAIYQLKRWYFFTIQPVESGTAIADKYIASVSLNLKDFCDLFSKVLNYYYNGTITIDLNPEWVYAKEPTGIEISYSYLWDVLIQLYDLFAVRWQIEPNGNADRYVIKVGYPTTELSHIFEYGFTGGLLKIERQVQNENIRNMILGRGGNQNLPYRYFKDVDQANDSFPADPDWIPELSSIYFSELRGATFRSYIQGWKAKHYNGATTREQSYAPWAWDLGYTDEKFNPVEYVKDDTSIIKYGELMGGLENTEDIYPSIQGVIVEPYGRIDEVVAVEEITSDNVEEAVTNDATLSDIPYSDVDGTVLNVLQGTYESRSLPVVTFSVPSGMYGNLDVLDGDKVRISGVSLPGSGSWDNHEIPIESIAEIASKTVTIRDGQGNTHSPVGLPEGTYYYIITVNVHNKLPDKTINISVEATNAKIQLALINTNASWSDRWNIWIKNIWGTAKRANESDEQYSERVWRPILGDREGEEAKVIFSDGWLSTSQDYEFPIIGTIVHDTSKNIPIKDADGNPTGENYTSEWRLTLGKSDADLEATGLYIPSTKRQGQSGDHFFFVGIDMPHQYVLWAEERLDAYKNDQLQKVKDIKPTWVVSLDKIRIANGGDADALINQLRLGSSVRLADKRFIINTSDTQTAYETLYLQSITYTYPKTTGNDSSLIPDMEIVLSDKYETTANPISTLSGEVNALARQLGAISNIEQIVRAVGDKIYLRKDGIHDRSASPTEFLSLVTSANFRNGIVGGRGWGIFKDGEGNWVFETDRLNVRNDMRVNTFVINQVKGQGGTIVESAAQMEITRVVETENAYVCYFDQKEGSVSNMFHVDDIAFCNRFTPDNNNLKFYKRRVTGIADDHIYLTRGYEAIELPDGTSDTGVNGTGIPEVGDAIIQYGNYTDPARRFIKIRDVVGGGYERYIDGLDSVYSTGNEYYFVGRMNGFSPQWFIGDRNGSYAEWKNNSLHIKGTIEMESGSSGLKNTDDFVDLEHKVDNIQVGGVNLMDGSALTALPSGWAVNANPPAFMEYQGYQCMVCNKATSGIYGKFQSIGSLQVNETITMSVWVYAGNEGSKIALGPLFNKIILPVPETNKWVRVVATTTFSSIGYIIYLDSIQNEGDVVAFRDFKVERGTIATDWTPSLSDQKNDNGDLEFIKYIFPSGLVNNVATVSQLLAVKDGNNNVRAGIYGGGVDTFDTAGFNDTEHGKLMFFAGSDELLQAPQAKSRIYEDGTIDTEELIAKKANITDSDLEDVTISGTIKSPFQNYDGSIEIGSEPIRQVYERYDNLNCEGFPNVSFDIAWDAAQIGRTITLTNYKYDGEIRNSRFVIFAKSGCYFFENGLAKNSIHVGLETIVLKGYGEGSTFYGWVVLSRTAMPNGPKPHILYEGIVEGGTIVKYRSYDNKILTSQRTDTGKYWVKFPSGISIPIDDYTVMLTGYSKNGTYGHVYACLHTKQTTQFEVFVADDDSLNDGMFTFQVINTADW